MTISKYLAAFALAAGLAMTARGAIAEQPESPKIAAGHISITRNGTAISQENGKNLKIDRKVAENRIPVIGAEFAKSADFEESGRFTIVIERYPEQLIDREKFLGTDLVIYDFNGKDDNHALPAFQRKDVKVVDVQKFNDNGTHKVKIECDASALAPAARQDIQKGQGLSLISSGPKANPLLYYYP